MRKLFLLSLALMATITLWAAEPTTIFEWGDMNQSSQPNPTGGTIANIGSLDGYASVKINTNSNTVYGLKCNSSMVNSNLVTKYYKIKPSSGSFEEGDTIIYTHVYNNSSNKTTTISAATIENNTIIHAGAQTINGRKANGYSTEKFVLTADADSLALGRVGETSTFILSIKVIRPADDGQPKLSVSPAAVTLAATAAVPSPSTTVTFSGKNLTAGTYNITVPSVAGLSVSPTSVTVGADGKLNAEVTITYTSNVDVAAASANVGLTINEKSATVAVNYSANMAKNYINASVDIEGNIITTGKKYGSTAALTAANIETAQVNGNDSLNNSKGVLRNEDYLGLKFEQSTEAYIAGWVKAGDVLRVKFGNIPGKVLVSLNGAAATEYGQKTYELNAAADTYVKFSPKETGSKLVLKQVQLNAALAVHMYGITYNATNGTLGGNKWQIAKPGETVSFTVSANDGYTLNSVKYNDGGEDQVLEAVDDTYSFTMPSKAVTITAAISQATALDNTDVNAKAVKRLENGMLVIEKNGVRYNAMGQAIH